MSFLNKDVPQYAYDFALLFNMRTQVEPTKHMELYTIRNVYLQSGFGIDKKKN